MIKQVQPEARTMSPARGRPEYADLKAEADRLYETYGKPLEQEHWGKFLAVSRDGRTVLGEDLEEVSREAAKMLGSGNFVFKVGDVAVGTIR